jgi:hypothetical protein
MTYQLAALRFRSIGERSARFTDLTLDLTAPADDDTVPQDSVIWLRNGGGKSSILSLLYAQLLPHANDFMGRTVQRSLTDYVDSGDTSHVVAVWRPADRSRTLFGEPEGDLLTGVVHEWADLHRPVQAAQSRDRLSTYFYAFHVIPGIADLSTLPFTDASGRVRRLAGFVETLKEQVRPYMQRANLIATDRQHTWTKALLDRRLDPEIFRTQKQMNHVEGGVEDLFKFPAAKDFIDFLLDLTTQPDAADSLARRLTDVTTLLAAKPGKISERDFCTVVAGDLDNVAHRHGQMVAAADGLRQAKNSAAHLAAAFAESVEAAEKAKSQLSEQEGVLTQARTAAQNERNQANDLLYLYRREAARLRIREAEVEEHEAILEAGKASDLVQAWEVALLLADAAGCRSSLAQAKKEAAAEEAELAPLRNDHARHAARLRIRLEKLAAEADTAAEESNELKVAADQETNRHRDLAKQARNDQQQATSEAAAARTQLDTLDKRRREGAEKGCLPTAATSPGTHLGVVIAQRDRLNKDLEDIDARVDARRTRRNEIRDREAVLTEKHSSADAQRTRSTERRSNLAERLTRLTNAPRLRELVEASDSEAIDLWGESSVLLRRLGDAVIAADDERVLRRAEQHADRRSIEAQERNQYLPTSLDAEHVQRELGPGVAAQAGWEYLRLVLPAERLVPTLNIPGIVRLGCGVVVPTDSVKDAVELLNAKDVRTTSLVGVYPAESADALISSALSGIPDAVTPAWTGLQPGLVDPDEAEAAVRLLKERAHAYQLKDQELARQRDADDELRREVTQFVIDCPAGHLAMLDGEIGRLDGELYEIEEEQQAYKTELKGLDEADITDESARKTIGQSVRTADITIAWLEELVTALEDEAQWSELLGDAERRATDADACAEDHAAKQIEAATTAHAYESASADERRKAQGYRAESAGVPDASDQAVAAADPAVPLDTLRRNQQQALRALGNRASQSVLADRVQRLTQEVADAEGEIGGRSAEDRHAATGLLSSPAGQEPQMRAAALEAARRADRDAAVKLGGARSAVAQRRAELASVETRTNPPRRTLPTVPTTATQADALASEQEILSQDATERTTNADALIAGIGEQMGQLKTRQQLLSTLLDSLPPASDTEPTPEPFTGTEDDARSDARNARGLVEAATKKVDTSESDLTAAIDQLRRTASRFPQISGPIKDRVTNDSPRVLGPNALDLAAKLRLRAKTLADELESIAKDQVILSEGLAHLVRESLDMLGKAERGSQMNTASGSWAGRKILRITFDRPDDADLVVYAERVIDKTVQKGLKPEGMPLLKAAVHEAAGPRGFTVKVLKPSDDATTTTEDISRLAKWSGGEKLTVCVALYCTLAALRAAHTGRGGRSGGVLLLDNPIGRASSSRLVRLQRDVAASHGIQLVYTTGVKDPSAVIQFPNVIRLDNRQGRTHSRRYIVAETVNDPSGDVTGIRVAHADHPWDTTAASNQQETQVG